MAKGDLTRAVQQTGGIDPVVATLNDMWNRKRQQDYYNNLMTAYTKGQQQLQGLGQQQTGNPLVANTQTTQQPQAGQNVLSLLSGQPTPQQTNNPLVSSAEKNIGNNLQPLPKQVNPLVAQGQQNVQPAQKTPASQNVLSLLSEQPNQLPIRVASPQQQKRQPYHEGTSPLEAGNPRNMQNYTKGMDIANQFRAQVIAQAMKNGADPDDAIALADILGEYAHRHYQPVQNTWKEIPPGGKLQEFDADGSPVNDAVTNPKEKEYTGKGTIELSKDSDGYPAGTKVDITWDKNNPGDIKIVGKAADNKVPPMKEGEDGYWYKWDAGAAKWTKTNLKAPSKTNNSNTSKPKIDY